MHQASQAGAGMRLDLRGLQLPGRDEPPSTPQHARQGQPSSLGNAVRGYKGLCHHVVSFIASDPRQSLKGGS